MGRFIAQGCGWIAQRVEQPKVLPPQAPPKIIVQGSQGNAELVPVLWEIRDKIKMADGSRAPLPFAVIEPSILSKANAKAFDHLAETNRGAVSMMWR